LSQPGAIDGTISPESDDATVVVDLPDGKVKIPRKDVAGVSKLENEAAPVKGTAVVEQARTIKTTHSVLLTNGRKLRGNLHKTPDSEPAKLIVGGLGVLSIPRRQIAADGIKEEEGTIDLPEEKKPEAVPEPKQPTPEEMKAELKREVREELLREMIDQIIEEKVQKASGAQASAEPARDAEPSLSEAQVRAIQTAVHELTRQRTQNRVRAERHLKSLGAAVLSYLDPAANHPFELTRRAVQRIVRDLGDPRGAPFAINALNDPDSFVRELAHEALRKIFPSSIAYSAGAAERARLKAQAEYRALWEETVRARAREAILRDLAAAE